MRHKTVVDSVEKTAQNFGDMPAYYSRKQGVDGWTSISWRQHWLACQGIASGLLAQGLERGARVGILSANSLEWAQAFLGAQAAGLVPVGIYSTSSSDQVLYIVNHCRAQILFVQNEALWEVHRARIGFLGRVVFLDQLPGFLLEGAAHFSEVSKSTGGVGAEDTACIIYTSGTTLSPKGVLLRHKNLLFSIERLAELYDLSSSDRYVSYLPLSHVAELLTTVIGPAVVGYSVYFTRSMEDLLGTLKQAEPTLFLGVPRVWDKLQSRLHLKFEALSFLKKTALKYARQAALLDSENMQFDRSHTVTFKLADRFVLSKIRKELGLHKTRLFLSGAAPISEDAVEFFSGLGIGICDVYGLSETAGPITASFPEGGRQLGYAGKALDGVSIRVAENGEILIKSPSVMCGYYGDPVATAECMTSDGYFKTGDLGTLDDQGFLKITGRLKNLLITSAGKNISAEALEHAFSRIPEIEHFVPVGDQKPFVSALMTLNPEALQHRRQSERCRQMGDVEFRAYLNEYFEHEFDKINRRLSSPETIKKFCILPGSFSESTGELTPTLKVKRSMVLKKYSADIDLMYDA